MSASELPIKENEPITPPSSFVVAPLTPPPTGEKAFTRAPRVIALFKDIESGRHVNEHSWTEFQLAKGEYDEIECQIKRDEPLLGFVRDKIRCVGSRMYRAAS